MLVAKEVIKESGIQFGTSGARGLVEQFTVNACAAFTHSFITSIQSQFEFQQVAIAIDNRPSSPAMAQACAKAVEQLGLEVIYYGVVPTPALAFVSMQDNIPCIMVTGSHIPFDRNGLKFYRPDGEINKADEQAILNAMAEFEAITDLPILTVSDKAASQYSERYTSLFDSQMLTGKRIGIYEHSSAGRDLYAPMFEALGAEVIALERSDEFVPIDTEAVSDADKQKAKNWSKEYNLDFIFSTDGDGDRPLVADENGDWLRGDILGLLCADVMNIEALAVPVSCNTAIESCERFNHVIRTKIGSPYVIAEFDTLAKQYNSVAGFEANGGFLLGSDTIVNNKTIKALPTRDAVLPALLLLAAAKEKPIYELASALPQRFTHSDRIQNFASEKSAVIISEAKENPVMFLSKIGFEDLDVVNVDVTDGLRMVLSSNDIIHLRPSGNAPELRCYAESHNMAYAKKLVLDVFKIIQV
ncbi:phosphomannomutase [Photobacterium angustum]|nr:phosphomannomutase [Photobacterium angustum]KJF81094.1 phosphomannomutase [Photobacterium damselae subsp. damselae]KJG33412.1 phosphomannomutase [Photobacterium angustum]KJG41704.1 phosphomannomutase [Photobacterium angustum]KJG44574.1 phosphomannomutase [Photobacterium angustum]KJG49703.1 phosphomannomutase [Photobacterium angustum]